MREFGGAAAGSKIGVPSGFTRGIVGLRAVHRTSGRYAEGCSIRINSAGGEFRLSAAQLSFLPSGCLPHYQLVRHGLRSHGQTGERPGETRFSR